jgi:hypothetical protein
MDWQTAVKRLQNHANLPGQGTEHESFVFALYTADRGTEPPKLAPHLEDVLRCLVVLNKELNAPNSIDKDSRREAAYGVAGILSSSLEYTLRWREKGRFDESVLKDLELAAWRIALVWEQVLAGDVEDLMEDLALEEAARFRLK